MEDIKEKNFFKKVWTSIKDFEGYEEFAAEKVTKAIKYIVILTLILTLIISIAYTIKFYQERDNVKKYISENIENITFKDGKIEVIADGVLTIEDENDAYLVSIFGATIFIYLLIVYLASNLVDAIVLGALGYLFSRIMRLRLRFKATFNIGAYALTLPILLNIIYIIVNTFTGFTINYFQWMYTTISYIYVVAAILMIKTEIINQRIQLIKLQQIQEQAAKEAEENENKEEENQQDKKDEENKEKEHKEETDGEPEGSNA